MNLASRARDNKRGTHALTHVQKRDGFEQDRLGLRRLLARDRVLVLAKGTLARFLGPNPVLGTQLSTRSGA